MAEPGKTSYDEVPYDAKPRYATHPDCLATMGVMLGMRPAPVERCRVLELGCSTGGNLFPLAESHPDSRFVGIDLSEVQIATGRKVAETLGLDNVRLEARSILDVDPGFGEFDYIIAHGVYSWVPEAVRDKVVSICKKNLAPQGIAYISYNVYPGWHLRAASRDLMNFHVRGLDDPQDKVEQARAILDFMVKHTPACETLWQNVLRVEADILRPKDDYYVFHEHLEAYNRPVYFHEFAAHAAAHGLQFLGEAQNHSSLAVFPPEVQETFRRLARDLVSMEQYIDFLINRSFRRSLLVHDGVPLNRLPGPEMVKDLRIVGLCRPRSPAPEAATAKLEEFENEHGHDISTNLPFTKAALIVLFEQWPRTFSFAELWQAVRERLGDVAASVPAEKAEPLLANSLVQLFLADMVGLHTQVPGFVLKPSGRPTTTRLIRLQARTCGSIANRRHQFVNLGVFEREVLALCDGRDRAAMVEALAARVKSSGVALCRDDRELTEDEEVRAALGEELESSLTKLARGALLVS